VGGYRKEKRERRAGTNKEGEVDKHYCGDGEDAR